MKPQKKKPAAPRAKPVTKSKTKAARGTKSTPILTAAKAAAPAAPTVPLPEPEKARPAVSKKALQIPPVLLEGDLPPTPTASGPGARYALAPEPSISQLAGAGGELPESYGTRNLFLAARDPHWLFASWDLTNAQQQEYNKRSRDGRLILRIFANEEAAQATPELQMHPESRSWFVHVPRSETRYRAELGYYDRAAKWSSIAVSRSTFTPPEAPSREVTAEFATIPPEISFQQIVEAVQSFVPGNGPLMESVMTATGEGRSAERGPSGRDRAREMNQKHKPAKSYRAEIPVRTEQREDWTPLQAQRLAKLLSVDSFRRVWMGSIEITELVRRHLREEIGSMAASDLARGPGKEIEANLASSGVFGSGPSERDREFWFNVNAELILYGSTQPDATVTIAGRTIKLRPDGSFSFRFSLPDGRYQLPAVAISRDEEDTREARLEFSRSSEYVGKVEPHPKDQKLRPPTRENVV